MPFSVSINVDGEDHVLVKFSNLNHAVKTWQTALGPIEKYLMEFFQNKVFDTEGAVYGSAWAALSPTYAAQKLRRWGDTTILIASGKMKGSYESKTGPLSLLIQNTAPYAKYHQKGTRKMPQRLLMRLDDTREKAVKLMIIEVLKIKVNTL